MDAQARGPLRRALDFLDDRANPILVKEVRQALRGKQFKITFWFTVVAATLIGVMIILSFTADQDYEDMGPAFFMSIFGCMVVAMQGFVPFMAFNAMGGEWEENTYDLLVISNLRPRQIVGGKLLSAGVQAMLFFSAFTPFLVFSFLLRGVDLLVVVFLLSLVIVTSMAASTLSLCLSSLTHVRFARIVLMATLAAILIQGCIVTIVFGGVLNFQPSIIHDPRGFAQWMAMFVGCGLLTAFTYAIACARLAHEEENRSTGLRVLTTLGLVVSLLWVRWYYAQDPDPEVLSGMGCTLLLLVLFGGIFFATEPEGLGRRTRHHVPRWRVLGILAAPFLPGGGRGMQLVVLQVLLLTAGLLTIYATGPSTSGGIGNNGGWAYFACVLYLFVYLGLPVGALYRFATGLLGRVMVRVAVPVFFLVATFVPSILGFFVGDRDLMQMEHPGHPFWLSEKIWNGNVDSWEGATLVVLAGLALLAILINMPRMLLGSLEVAKASAKLARKAPVELEPPVAIPEVDAVPEP